MTTQHKVGHFSSGELSYDAMGTAMPPNRRAWPVEVAMLERLLKAVGIRSLRLVLWDGQQVNAPAPASDGVLKGSSGTPQAGAVPLATFHIPDRNVLYSLIANPAVTFGDGYAAGLVQIDGDLVRWLENGYRGIAAAPPGWLRKWITACINRPRRNTLSGSHDNIHSHYDIGNDFYRLWLDEQLLYTCAYFPEQDISLEASQIAKMDHVCRKLRLRPGQTVVETGCGWGALSLHMARHYGVKVKAFNISHQQILYAQQRAEQEGLADRVEFIEDDYRHAAGTYDAFVSVGMLEHVGIDNYAALGAVIDRCLKPTGTALIHTIGRNKPRWMDPWIEKRIFPGAYPPTLRQMMDLFEPFNFSVLDVENLRLHYALTVRHWLARFEQHRDEVARMFDDRFVRTWRLYLAGSIAAFTTGTLQLFQVVFNRGTSNEVPWTRGHLYAPESDPLHVEVVPGASLSRERLEGEHAKL